MTSVKILEKIIGLAIQSVRNKLRGLGTPGRFSAILTKGITFVTSCFVFLYTKTCINPSHAEPGYTLSLQTV